MLMRGKVVLFYPAYEARRSARRLCLSRTGRDIAERTDTT